MVKNAEELAAGGVKEIVLTGVNLGDFGKGPDGESGRNRAVAGAGVSIGGREENFF